MQEILTRRYPLSNISLAQIKTALSEGSAPIWPSSAVPEYCSHKTDSNIYVSLQVMCQRCWGSVSESRPTMGEIRRQLLRSASSKQRLRQLLFESKELDLTKKTPDEYRRRINGGFADIYIRVLDDNAIVAEKSIRFFKNDDTEKIAKVSYVALIKLCLFYLARHLENSTGATSMVITGSPKCLALKRFHQARRF